MKVTMIDSEVIAQILDGNSSFYLTVLTIEATLSVIVNCNTDSLNYYPQNSKLVVHSMEDYVNIFLQHIENTVIPSAITLIPTTIDPSSYQVLWTPSYYNTSRYMITVYPPESYTQEDLIIHNTGNSTVHKMTIALNDCPNTIYSTFVLGKAETIHYKGN